TRCSPPSCRSPRTRWSGHWAGSARSRRCPASRRSRISTAGRATPSSPATTPTSPPGSTDRSHPARRSPSPPRSSSSSIRRARSRAASGSRPPRRGEQGPAGAPPPAHLTGWPVPAPPPGGEGIRCPHRSPRRGGVAAMSTPEPRSGAGPAPAQHLNAKVVGISIAAAVGGFLFGFDTSVINGAVNALSDEFSLGAGLTGFAVSSALLGCAIGAWFAGALSNRFGRIPVMVIAAILFFISAVGSGLAFGVWDLIVWRVVGGLGVGAASVIAPAYIAEVAPAKFRGRLGSLQQLAIVLGIFTALLSNAVIANSAGGSSETFWLGVAAWRWMFMIEAVPAAAYGIMALFLPESPRFLVRRNELDRASKVLYD